MTKTRTKAGMTRKAVFTIPEKLAEIIDGMEATNWSTSISKNDVRTVSAVFRVRRPTVEVATR